MLFNKSMLKIVSAFVAVLLPLTVNLAHASDEHGFIRDDFPYQSNFIQVLGSKMHYVDTGGTGTPLLLIHGQPTWSYLWRNVIPSLQKDHRVIAVDLIGFGLSDKPDIDYTIADHSHYLDNFIHKLDLKDFVMVVHDWGGFLGMDYAARFPERVKALALMETVIPHTESFTSIPKTDPKNLQGFAKVLAMLSTDGLGEKMIFEDNMFIEQLLPTAVSKPMTQKVHDAYRLPFSNGENRRAMLQFPREVAIFGNASQHVLEARSRIRWSLMNDPMEKLLLTFTPGALVTQDKIDWAKNNIPNLTTRHLGKGVHFVQEDQPQAIGQTIAAWMKTNKL